MSTNNSAAATSFEKLAKAFNRKKLLQKLGLPIRCPRVADLKGLRTFSTSVKSALCVHESHVPLFGKSPGEICSGAKLMRHGRVTVGVPCGATEISNESGFCLHCEKLFLPGFDDDGFVEIDESTMEETVERYEPGKSCVLWNIPAAHREFIPR